jgi:hypothetical protein
LVAALALSACGGSGAKPTDGGSSDGAADQITGALDAGAGAAVTCTTLVWVFGGCTTTMLDECAREYAAFPASMQGDLDAYAACLRTMVMGLPDAAVSTGIDVDAGCPTTPNSLNRWYMHGGCEGLAGQVSHDLGTLDQCTGTSVSCTTIVDQASCDARFGVCTWTAGACTDLGGGAPPSCAQAAGSCALVPGCTGTAVSDCGGAGQPLCFFSQELPSSGAL